MLYVIFLLVFFVVTFRLSFFVCVIKCKRRLKASKHYCLIIFTEVGFCILIYAGISLYNFFVDPAVVIEDKEDMAKQLFFILALFGLSNFIVVFGSWIDEKLFRGKRLELGLGFS